jgi:microcystin-dependent protein
MSDPFVGEVQIYGFSFPPKNWAFCNGGIVQIRQNTTLFSLIGTVYGGNGTTTFQLPNLASRQACSSGAGPGLTPRVVGETFGAFAVTLSTDELPAHNHGMNIYTGSTETDGPSNNSGLGIVQTGNFLVYAPAPGTPAAMSPNFVLPAGGGQSHANVQPFLGINYSIALEGIFPSFG